MNAPILISVRRKLSPVCQAATWLLALMAVTMSLQAQWTTQTFSLKSGWNAVYLHVDCTHADLASQTPLEIQEIWMWQPAPTTIQFVQNPQEPIETGTQWKNWKRVEAINALQRLIGNTAYLVRTTADVSWSLKGKPVPPRQQWTSSGLNFIGYPTVPSSPPTFESFFSQAPAVRQALQTYYYDGGELGANNPRELFNFMLSTRTVTRGEAYWLRADGQYYAPYGPFEVKLAGGRALDFGETASQISFRIRNLNPATNTVTLKLIASEAPPSGELSIAGTPTLLLRGALNTVNLTHAYSSIAPDGTATFVLPPAGKEGSETEVVIGINRAALAQAPGSILAGIVRLTDSFGFSQIDLPLSLTVASKSGLWVGSASVGNVNAYLKSFQKNPDGSLATAPTITNAPYVVTGIQTGSAPASRPFPLRLIIHADASGNAVLLQRAFHGLDSQTNTILSLRESNLDTRFLASARRVSAPHLPWQAANSPWPFTGEFREGGSLTNTVVLNHSDHASNPFLHTYHPDHDGLDASFQTPLAQGVETYGVSRKMVLSFLPPADDFTSLTSSGQKLSGAFSEQITILGNGTESRTFSVGGTFQLNRISGIATLTP